MTDTSHAGSQSGPLEATLDVPHPPEQVWALISDLTQMPKWSPQVRKTFVRGGGPTRHGARMININRRGLLVWPTQSKVVTYDAPQKLAFRVKDNFSVWSFTLEPTADGTRLIERRETPQGISPISRRLTKALLGGKESFERELVHGMQTTLTRIAAELDRR